MGGFSVKKMCANDGPHDLIDSRSLLNVVRRVIALSVATALLNVTMIADADFSIASDAGKPVTFSVRTQECEGTSLSVSEGAVDIRTGDKVRTLKTGDNFSTFVDAPTQGAPQNFTHRKRVGLIIGISAAVTILLIAVIGRDHEVAAPGGCIDILSGQSTCR